LSLANPAVAAVARIQEDSTPSLLGIPGVVGTATGVDADGQLVIKVFTEGPGVAGLPGSIGGRPVAVRVTGPFRALAVNPASAFPRPVPIGVSIGHPEVTAGTFGCRVRTITSEDEVLYFLLSNNHVIANQNDATIGDPIFQPGVYDGGTPADQLAVLHDFEAIVYDGRVNLMDAAIALTTDSDAGAATPDGAGAYGAPSATTRAAELGLRVQKYGRTTSLTQGQVTDLNATVEVCYQYVSRGQSSWCDKSAVFYNQIIIGVPGFSAGGDSGSLIVTDDGSKNPVALLFAGSDSHTIASPIDTVLTRFEVMIDDGTGTTTKGHISGTVTDAVTQLGIEGVKVTVDRTGQYSHTDATGAFALNDVPTGETPLVASLFGYESATLLVEVIEDTISEVEFSLVPLPRGTVSGTVRDVTSGLPIEGAVVRVSASGQSALTASDGGYALLNVTAEDHQISATRLGYSLRMAAVTVEAEQTLMLDFALQPAIVAPNAFAETEAASYSTTLSSSLRLQEVYAADHFGGAPVWITGLAFRVDNPSAATAASLADSGPQSGARTNTPNPQLTTTASGLENVPIQPQMTETIDVRVRLSTTDANPDGLNLRFASNAGNNEQVVFDGILEINGNGGAGASEPNGFEVFVPLNGPGFYYDPTTGNLLCDISTYTAGNLNVDASSATDDGASRIFALDAHATKADSRDTGADVIQFSILPVGNLAPSAAFTYVSTELTVAFTDQSSDPDGSVAARAWDFGDGTTSTVQNPEHTYATGGTYTVTLTATDNEGASSLASDQITVPKGSIYGIVSDSITGLGVIGALVQVEETGQSALAASDGSYTLPGLDDGSYTVLATAAGYTRGSANVVVDQAAAVSLDFALYPAIVAPNAYADTEAASLSTTLSSRLRMQQVYHSDHFGSVPLTIAGLALRLDNPAAAASLDGKSNATNHPNAQLTAAPQAVETIDIHVRLSTTSALPGYLDLDFADNAGADEQTIFDGLLNIDAMGGAGPNEPNSFEIVIPVEGPGFYYDPSAGNLLCDISTYTPGTALVDTSSSSSDGASRIWISNPDALRAGNSDTGADVIQFRLLPAGNQPPVADFSYTAADLTVTFTDRSIDADGSVLTWAWDFGDGTTSTESSPQHTFATEGTYTVVLTVTDDEEASGSVSDQITVPKGSVYGTVVDSITGLAIEGALVRVKETAQSTITASDGSYALPGLDIGDYTVSASAARYGAASTAVTLTGADALLVDFALHPALVAPNAYAETEAASLSTTLSSRLRMQQVYHSDHFGSVPLTIAGLALRLDNPAAAASLDGKSNATNRPNARLTATPQAVETIDIQVRLSTTSANPGYLDLDFANNAGADQQTIFDGLLNINATGGAGPNEPNSFEIVIPVEGPGFYYDPAAGNLLCDISTYTPGTVLVDTSDSVSDGASRIWIPDPDATRAGTSDTGADVIQFRLLPAANQPPVADFSYTATDFTVAFTDQSIDADGSVLTWAWDFMDGTTSAESSPQHTYGTEGTYTVLLTVTDNEGASNSTSEQVTVSTASQNGLALTAVGSKVRGSTYVDLTWEPFGPGQVEILLNGEIRTTTDHDGAYQDSLGKGGGTYIYQLRIGAQLSNEAVVTF
jgi:PKD repeat protein